MILVCLEPFQDCPNNWHMNYCYSFHLIFITIYCYDFCLVLLRMVTLRRLFELLLKEFYDV